EVFTPNQLHHERPDVVGLFQAVDVGDVRVIQRGESLGFALEAGHPVHVRRKRLGQELDRDVPVEACVARLVHFAHPACSERAENLVSAEPRAWTQRHGQRPSGRNRQIPDRTSFAIAITCPSVSHEMKWWSPDRSVGMRVTRPVARSTMPGGKKYESGETSSTSRRPSRPSAPARRLSSARKNEPLRVISRSAPPPSGTSNSLVRDVSMTCTNSRCPAGSINAELPARIFFGSPPATGTNHTVPPAATYSVDPSGDTAS